MQTANIIKISRFCTHDGPGIRTSVFLKGCPLRCLWCHNPESQCRAQELSFDARKCVGCMRCAQACERGCHTFDGGRHEIDREKCAACGRCAEVCPAEALVIEGAPRTADEVLREIEKDRVYYETSGGGMTLTGGEPLFSPEFTRELLGRCRERGIHTAIETSGFASEAVFRSCLEHCDTVLFDVKETDPALHEKFTGVPLEPILRNLRILDSTGIPYVIRLPIIPDLNDRPEHHAAVQALADTLTNCRGTEIMPYHTLGVYKYALLGREYTIDT